MIIWLSFSLPQGDDYRMREIMHLAHEFLQHFCRNNHTNQGLLHRHLDLFLQSGDNVRVRECEGVKEGVWRGGCEVGRSMKGRNTFCRYLISVCCVCIVYRVCNCVGVCVLCCVYV